MKNSIFAGMVVSFSLMVSSLFFEGGSLFGMMMGSSFLTCMMMWMLYLVSEHEENKKKKNHPFFKRKFFQKGDVIVSPKMPDKVFIFIEAIGFDGIKVIEIYPKTFLDIGEPVRLFRMIKEEMVFNFHPKFNPGEIHPNYS